MLKSFYFIKKSMTIRNAFNQLFEPELLEEIENHGVLVSVKSGSILIQSGQIINQIPIVLSGLVKVTRMDDNGNELLLYYIGSKESCAMTFTCCMQKHPSEINAMVEEDAEILLIPIQLMDEWMMKFTTWKSFVMTTVRLRFNELLKSIDQIAFMKLDERLVTYLKDKVKSTGSTIVNASHQTIAEELASSRVVISRLLKKLENDKKVILYRNQIKVMKEL